MILAPTKTNLAYLIEMLAVLQIVRTGHNPFLPPFTSFHPSVGICQRMNTVLVHRGNYTEMEIIIRSIRTDMFKKWPHFSGNEVYPVPSTVRARWESPKDAFMSIKNLWSKRTNYGRLRWDLLEFMIDQTQKDIQNMKCQLKKGV